MPRAPRNFADGLPHHVIARANAGVRVFRAAGDYAAFLALLAEALERRPVAAHGYCLMPNHLHLVLQPSAGPELSRFMQWLLTTFSARLHRRRKSTGHVWQGRFRAFPIQDDAHLLTVLRYVERNALRAGLCEAAQDWPWSSLAARESGSPPVWLSSPPVALPRDWTAWVNEPQTAAELEAIRRSVNRGAPFGSAEWARATAVRLGVESTLRAPHRPRRPPDRES